jgi:predicted transcriptional regulator
MEANLCTEKSLLDRFEALAKQRHRSTSQLVEEALSHYLEDEEHEALSHYLEDEEHCDAMFERYEQALHS